MYGRAACRTAATNELDAPTAKQIEGKAEHANSVPSNAQNLFPQLQPNPAKLQFCKLVTLHPCPKARKDQQMSPIHATNPRSGAFVIATPNNIGIAIRRPNADAESGYAVWQVDDRPFVIASPTLPGIITQAELADRVNAMARISDAWSTDDIHSCVGNILTEVKVSEDVEAEMFDEQARQLARQVAIYTDILHGDLISQGGVPDISETIRQSAPRAIQGYIRGWYISFGKLTKERLLTRYHHAAHSAVANALRGYDIDNSLVEEVCDVIFDEIMSFRLSPWAKQIIVTGFSHCNPQVYSVEFDGSHLGEPKINSSEHNALCGGDQSFFFDAGNCYEVGRFARGLNSDAYKQAISVTASLLYKVDNKYRESIGGWEEFDSFKPKPIDIATLALKSMEFSGAGLFGQPVHSLVKNASPSGILDAMNVLCRVADLQDELLGVKEPAWSETVVLDQTGIIANKESGATSLKNASERQH